MLAAFVYGAHQTAHRRLSGLLFLIPSAALLIPVAMSSDAGILAGNAAFMVGAYFLYRLTKRETDLLGAVGMVAVLALVGGFALTGLLEPPPLETAAQGSPATPLEE